MTFKSRIAALEKGTGGGLIEVQITGGMPGSAPGLAMFGGMVLHQDDGEADAAFRARARAEARLIGAPHIIYDGLPA
jgi:hypothetical protein